MCRLSIVDSVDSFIRSGICHRNENNAIFHAAITVIIRTSEKSTPNLNCLQAERFQFKTSIYI